MDWALKTRYRSKNLGYMETGTMNSYHVDWQMDCDNIWSRERFPPSKAKITILSITQQKQSTWSSSTIRSAMGTDLTCNPHGPTKQSGTYSVLKPSCSAARRAYSDAPTSATNVRRTLPSLLVLLPFVDEGTGTISPYTVSNPRSSH